MPESGTEASQALVESIRDFALGGLVGFVIGFLLKKALKLGLLLLAAFVAWQLFTYGTISPEYIETAQSVGAGATNIIEQHANEISSVKKLFQLNTELAIGFFAGLALGLWRG
jgi:uncharacterized membrane protein (Fun14 family)